MTLISILVILVQFIRAVGPSPLCRYVSKRLSYLSFRFSWLPQQGSCSPLRSGYPSDADGLLGISKKPSNANVGIWACFIAIAMERL